MLKRLALIALTLSFVLAADAKTWRTERYEFDSSSIRTLEIEHAVGELEITAGRGEHIEIHMRIECSSWRDKCGSRAENIELEAHESGSTLRIRIDGFPKTADSLSVDLEIRMPARLSLDVDRGVGETTIRGIDGDISVEAGVGEVSITGSVDAFGEVEVECGVGEADLDVPEGRVEQEGFLFLGNELKWKGPGQSVIEVEVGVGSVEIELE